MRHLSLVAAITALCAFASVGAQAQQAFFSGYAGSVPSDPELQPRAYFNRKEVRALFAAMETGPVPVSQAEAALKDSTTGIDDLLRTHLLRRDGDMLAIDFAYFSCMDMERIHAVVEKRAPSLAAAFAAKRSEFDRIFARYRVPGVSRGDLAFVILAGVSLNWDGLDLTLDSGLRTPRFVETGGGHYSFWAAAKTPNYSYSGFYWGSSSFPVGVYNFKEAPADYTFSSFGDPYSYPRMNFPDLFDLPINEMTGEIAPLAERIGLKSEELAGISITDALGFSLARPAAAILFALRDGAKDERDLVRRLSPDDTARAPAILALLEAGDYVRRDDRSRYELTAPVLDRRDQRMLDEALALSRSIMADWLAVNYEPVRDEIGPLTIDRHGLSYAAAFTQIWHELFGATTRELVKTGLVSDPRAEGAASPGSKPLLWRKTLYDLVPG